MSVEIEVDTGERFTISVVNLSLAGMQWACNHYTADRLLPEGARPFSGTGPELRMRLALPLPDGTTKPVSARCRVVFARRLSADAYRLGVQFVDFDDDDEAVLANYVQVRFGTGN